MVEFVRHTFLEGTITLIKDHHYACVEDRSYSTHLHVNNVPNFINFHVRGKVFHSYKGKAVYSYEAKSSLNALTMPPKLLGEEIPGAPTVAISVNHLARPYNETEMLYS